MRITPLELFAALLLLALIIAVVYVVPMFFLAVHA